MKKVLLLGLFSLGLFSCSKDAYNAAGSVFVPRVETKKIKDVGENAATGRGLVVSANGGTILAKGICWGTANNPTVDLPTTSNEGPGQDTFSSPIPNLEPDTKYYYRAYATNEAGTAYGQQMWFRSHIATEPVTDVDGNVYRTILIGDQLWMAENLRTTHYCTGDEIPHNPAQYWTNLNAEAWAYQENNPANNVPHGKLYNWYVASDARNPCPCDWHVPTKAEWEALRDFVGHDGGKLKQADTWPWPVEQEDGATNETGFSAYPSGFRSSPNLLYYFGYNAGFWLTGNMDAPATLHAGADVVTLNGHTGYGTGASIRCVKN